MRKTHPLLLLLVSFVLIGFLKGITAQEEPAARGQKPNVILIYADDMGYDAVSSYNDNLGLETPNLDQLARQGMKFTDAHSTSGVCSPSRYSLLTGRYHWRTRLKSGIVNKWEPSLIKADRLTMPEMLKKAGYQTACFGKWHLGWNWTPEDGDRITSVPDSIDFDGRIPGGPVDHGFDYYFGDDVPNWPPFAWRVNDRILGDLTTTMQSDLRGVSGGPAVANWDFEKVLPRLTKRSAEYIRTRADDDQPFFLYFSMTTPHTPIVPSDRFREQTGISKYADFLVETDWAVGQVLKAIRQSGQKKNTLVIFTADNGTSPAANFKKLESEGVHLREHWRGWKADAYEGGHRVPFIVRWPGHVPKGTTSDLVISQVDVMATLADVAGRTLPDDAGEDSRSLLPVLRDPSVKENLQKTIVATSYQGYYAVRKGSWKVLFCRGSGGWSPPNEKKAKKKGLPPVQLYNLEKDPDESTNLQSKHPERVEQLKSTLKEYVERGRSTPGSKQSNHKGKVSWKLLPWREKPE